MSLAWHRVHTAVQEVFPEEWDESYESMSSDEGYDNARRQMGNPWFLSNVAYDVLDRLKFYDWAVMPDGGVADSDNAIPQVEEILSKIDYGSSPSEKLVAINRCLDVYHQRSDWAAAFIDGGRDTLRDISSGAIYSKIGD